MKTKTLVIIALFGLALAGQLSANTLPIHIDPFNQSEYDEIVWGCRLSRCIHTYHEQAESWESKTPDKHLVACYTNWLATDGTNLMARWRAGEPITNETDKLYLPLAKTEFWDELLMRRGTKWDGSKAYFRWRKLPDLSKFPAEDQADHADYQATLEAGLPVLHKIYNQQTLTDAEKAAFYDWALAYYCSYYIGGVVPEAIPADSWYTYTSGMRTGTDIQQGDIVPNVPMYKPEHFWSKPEFSETNYFDVSLHLRTGKTNELLQQYIDFAQYWEPVPGNYPKVQPKFPAADAPDTDEYRTLYNFLKEENKPTLFATWLINGDEGNRRLAPRLHFLHRIWRHKIGFAFAEGSVNKLVEKNDLRFGSSENEQYRTHLMRCFSAPFMPIPCASPIFKPFMCPPPVQRLSLMNSSAEYLGGIGESYDNADFGQYLCRVMGVEKRLIAGFSTLDGFEPDVGGPDRIPAVSEWSVVSNRIAQCESNGYPVAGVYNHYASHTDAIGEIIAVDTNTHTVTLLREEYHEEDYPMISLKERFPGTYTEYESRDHGNHGKFHFDDLAARKADGNSIAARTLTFDINIGVCMFLNGDEMPDETCLKVGDVASIIYKEENLPYPRVITAIRYNFPPEIQSMANTGAQTVELRGIDDENLIVEQDIVITAESLDPAKMADPVVSYTPGNTVCELTYTAPAPSDTVTVRVILTDDGGSEFGGTNATEVLLKFTENGAVLASPPDTDGDGMPDT